MSLQLRWLWPQQLCILKKLDESLKHWDKVWPAAGAHNNAICVSLEELEQYSGAKGWVDVTKAAA